MDLEKSSHKADKPVSKISILLMSLLHNAWFKIIGFLFVIIFSVIYLKKQYIPISNLINILNINVWFFLISVMAIIAALVMSVFTWRKIEKLVGYDVNWINSARIHILSIISKYVPGYILQFGSKVLLSDQEGIPFKASGKAIIVEVVLTNFIGFLLAIFFVSNSGSFHKGFSTQFSLFLRIIGPIIICAILIVLYLGIRKFNSHLQLILKLVDYLYVVGFIIATWLMASYGFFLLSQSLGIHGLNYIQVVVTLTSSIVIGVIAIIVPYGLVVREAVTVYLLRNTLTEAQAILLSGAYRLEMIICELLFAVIVLIIWAIKKHNIKSFLKIGDYENRTL